MKKRNHSQGKKTVTNAELRKIKLELKELQVKLKKAEKEAQLVLRKKFAQLHKKREDLEITLQEWKHAGEGALKDLKRGFKASWADLKKSIQKATSRF